MTNTATTITQIDTLKVPPRWIMVRVTTADGASGWGEAIVPKRSGAVIGAVDDISRNIIGRDSRRIEDLWQRMYRGSFYRGGPVLNAAIAGIEMALWDLKGRSLGVPVYELLGGSVRDRIRTYAWIGGETPADVVDRARTRVSQGFTAVKMGATEQTDHLERHSVIDDAVARVASLRDAFPNLGIALDFHGRVPRMAARVLLKELEPYRLMWVEEPGTNGSVDQLREVARATTVPIALGERLYSRWDVKAVLADGVVDILQPDISITGLFELEKIARMAEPYDVAIAPHCPNGPISLAASLQAGFCCPNVVIQEQSPKLHYHGGYADTPPQDRHDYLREMGPLDSSTGYFEIGSWPGLGVDIDAERITSAASDWHLPDPDWQHADGRYAEW